MNPITPTNPKGAGRKKNPVPTVLLRRMIPKSLFDKKPSAKLITNLLTDHYKSKEDGTKTI